MYCPNCKRHFESGNSYCPDCVAPNSGPVCLVEDPRPKSGVSLNGDANAISGGIHSDSHDTQINNNDYSVHYDTTNNHNETNYNKI